MAAAQAEDLHFESLSVKSLSAERNRTDPGHAAGAADSNDSFVFGIDVDEAFALERGNVDGFRTVQTGFFFCCEDRFYARVGKAVIIQHRQHECCRDAVVAAEGRAFCIEQIAVNSKVQTFRCHILRAGFFLIADHIDVSLQNHRFASFIASGSFLDDNHVVQLVLVVLQISCLCEIHEPVAELLGVAGSMGNLTDLLEESENLCRFISI